MGQGASGQLRSGLGQLTDGIENDDRQNPTDFFFALLECQIHFNPRAKKQRKKSHLKPRITLRSCSGRDGVQVN